MDQIFSWEKSKKVAFVVSKWVFAQRNNCNEVSFCHLILCKWQVWTWKKVSNSIKGDVLTRFSHNHKLVYDMCDVNYGQKNNTNLSFQSRLLS